MTKQITLFNALMTFISYASIASFGFLSEIISWFLPKKAKQTNKNFAPLVKDLDDFYNRRMFQRVHDCWNRPVSSRPGAWIDVQDREFINNYYERVTVGRRGIKYTGETVHALNLGSYNYLGFADNEESCNTAVIDSLNKYGCSSTSSSIELGKTQIHDELEKCVASFLGKEAAMVFGMGFATNSTTIPGLASKGDLIVSDSLNHASIVFGSRGSGAKIKVFRHNDMKHLEKVLRESISEGQPRTHRPWKKIFILVEGIYSMEGDIVNLPAIIDLKKKYKCYLYVDEAHSIGALGKTGGGVVQYWGLDPADVDILMGTFTKSFASVGGYIASSQDVIRYLKLASWGSIYANSISTPCAQQIISAMRIIRGEDGTNVGYQKVMSLRDNSNYFRTRLAELGFEVLGSHDSPVIPIMIYNPGKVAEFSRELLRRNIAVVVVGYPAVPLMTARARFCLSSGHTREDIDGALNAIHEVGELLLIKYGRKVNGKQLESDEKQSLSSKHQSYISSKKLN